MHKPHIQRLAIGTSLLLVVTGSPEQILDYTEQEVTNKRALVSVAVRKDDKQAMIAHVTDFDGSVADAKASIPAPVLKSVLGGYDTKDWNFYNMFGYMGSKLDVVVGSKMLEVYQTIKRFAGSFAKRIFAKGGFLSGSADNTRTLALIGPDGERSVYAWNYETADNVVISQPFSADLTRYSIAGMNLVALRQGTNEISAMTRKDIGGMINGENESNWQQHVINGDVQIDDLSFAHRATDGIYSMIGTGKVDGKKSLLTLTVIHDDNQLDIATTDSPLELDDETASYGSVVRFDEVDTTFVNMNGGENTVTKVPTKLLPQPVRETFQAAA